MSFQEVFVGDESIKLPIPFKRDIEWLGEFKILNKLIDENENKLIAAHGYKDDDDDYYDENGYKDDDDDTGAYLMIINIGYLFGDMGDFRCNKDKKLFELWGLKESVIKKRIEIIDKCLDVYDIIFPFNRPKIILSRTDLKGVYELMDRLFYDTCYPVMDENGVDLNMELGSPGWLDLKKVLLRFFSKIKINRKFKRFEEEVEGTGHVRLLYRKNGTSLKGTGTFLLSLSNDDDKNEVEVDGNEDEDEEENYESDENEVKVDGTKEIVGTKEKGIAAVSWSK